MEKVILITSRKIGKANISLFKEIEYGSILIESTAPDIKGYFRQFLEWVRDGNSQRSNFKNIVDNENFNENKKKDNCKKNVSALIEMNEPKNEDTPFKLGIFKRKINPDGPTIYLAEEFPCKGDKKNQFTEEKQRYLNSIIMEIKNDMGSDTEIEWLILSHDNDWGKEGGDCLKNKGEECSSVSVNTDYSELEAVVNNKDNAEIWAFRHISEDDTYQFAKSLMEGENYDFKMYLDKAERQRKEFADFLDGINNLKNIDMDAFRDLKIDPKIPFIPHI